MDTGLYPSPGVALGMAGTLPDKTKNSAIGGLHKTLVVGLLTCAWVFGGYSFLWTLFIPDGPPVLIMNSIHSLYPIKSVKASNRDERDDQKEAAVVRQSPLSPSMLTRPCPGQATLANPNSFPDSSLHPSSSLLRFIDSSVFTAYHAMYYLFRPTTETWEYLGRRLFAYPTNELDFYLPQLLVLFLRCDEGNRCVLPYLASRVHSSLRFAAQLAWHLDTYQTSSKSPSNSITSNTSSNVLNSLKPVSFNSTTSSSSTATTAVEVVQKFGQEGAIQDGDKEEDTDSSSTGGSLNCQGDNEDDNGYGNNDEKGATPQKNDLRFTINKPKSPSLLADKSEQLTKHKRAASDLTFLTGLEVQAGEKEQAELDSQDGESGLEDNDDDDNEEDRRDAYDITKSARSESWVRMHSRFHAPAVASRSDTHLHVRPPQLPRTAAFSLSSYSTDLLCLPPSQTQQLGRLQEILTDFLDAAAVSSTRPAEATTKVPLCSDKLVRLCRSQWDFVNALLCISRRLTAFPSKEQRTSHLQAELYKLNLGLPARVWLPVEKTEHVVLRIPPSAAVCLNSAEKAPYLIYVEILACNDVMTARLPQRTGVASGLAPSNIPNNRFHDNNISSYSLQLTPSSPKMCLSGARAIAAPDVISLFSTDSGESVGTLDSSMMTFAAGPSSPLDPAENSSASKSQSQKCKQPTVRYVNAKDIRRRLEQNAACQPQRSFKLDPEDPSAAVLKEPWELKSRRIQESSPWGHLPGWQLAAAIVKVGDDLRQEQLAYQLLNNLQRIWAENRVDLWLRPLNIVITSRDSGMIELVQDTVSLHQIRRHAKLSLRDYIIREHGSPNSEGFLAAQRNFVQSCAAYCVVGYLFQVKDRHNGNILIDKEGHVIHIDYGYMLSASPGRNLGFEMSPFKLTTEQVELMGGVDSDMFTYYKSLILRGLLTARKHMEELILLVDITRTGYPHLPCFVPAGGKRTVEALRQRFMLNCTEDHIARFVDYMIRQSLNSFTTRLYDNYQYYANGIQ
ncbi:hypothetical protein Aperf_G00000108548 [Anoplocephala perfoliata]